MKLRYVLFGIDKKYKKNKKYAEDESDIDEETVVEIEEKMKEKEKERAEKRFAKENEKLIADDEKPQDDSVLQERLEEIDAEFERLVKERGTGKASLKREKPAEKIEEAIDKLDERINTAKLQMVDREAGKEIALGTRSARPLFRMGPVLLISFTRTVRSTIWTPGKATGVPSFSVAREIRRLLRHAFCHHVLVISPLLTTSHVAADRITVAWCKKFDVPVEKLFSKTLLQKCTLSSIQLSVGSFHSSLLETPAAPPLSLHVPRYVIRLFLIFPRRPRFSKSSLISVQKFIADPVSFYV